MKRTERAVPEPRVRATTALHLKDYLDLLRQHRPLVWGIFLLVFGGLAGRALLATPVYRSGALIQIEGKPSPGGLLGELQAIQNASSTEAEMEIMRSRRVALGASQQLEPGDFLVEEHAYRPLEVLLGRLMGDRPTCEVRLETSRAEAGTGSTWVFEFRPREGTAAPVLHVERRDHGGRRETAVPGFVPGVPFAALGRAFTLHVRGEPAGRRYRLELRPPVETARWIQERLICHEVGRRTGMVSLAFEGETPRLARRVAEALSTSYLALKKEHKREQARTALEFLQSETERVRTKLQEAEETLDRSRAELNAVLLSERAQWIVEKMSTLELQRAEQQVLLEEQRRVLGSLRSTGDPAAVLAGLQPGPLDPVTTELSGQLARLELEREGMVEEGVRPEHPQRKRIEAEIRGARDRLRGGIEALLRGGIAKIESHLKHLDATVASYEEEARQLPQTERRIAELTREEQANLRIYGFLVQKEQEAQIALVSTLATVRSIDRPVEPVVRSRPHLLFQGVLALILAGAAAFLAAWFAEYLDRSVKSPQELESAAGLALYAAVPHFRSVRSRTLGRFKGALVVRDRPHSVLAEAYRTLRTNLRFAGLEKEVKTLAITSSVVGEGKTVTLCNLAAACAQQGERVILVDMDLRRPDTHTHFAGRRAPGLTEWLEEKKEWQEVVLESGVEGLHVVHAGSKAAHPAALLDSERVQTMLEVLREQYDRVLVDVPPVLAVSDAAAFFSHLDGVLLLTRYKACTPGVVLDARDQIRRIR
ncbi:MAG: polysaccharide biosynthesis tyrosine autokinase [Planctomycetota bacterium]